MENDQKLTGIFPIEHSSLYQFWTAQKDEILKNKWYLSEKAGKDIGFDHALWDWHWNYRDIWISGIKSSGTFRIL